MIDTKLKYKTRDGMKKYRIVQDGNGMFLIQEKCWFGWKDVGDGLFWVGSTSRYETKDDAESAIQFNIQYAEKRRLSKIRKVVT